MSSGAATEAAVAAVRLIKARRCMMGGSVKEFEARTLAQEASCVTRMLLVRAIEPSRHMGGRWQANPSASIGGKCSGLHRMEDLSKLQNCQHCDCPAVLAFEVPRLPLAESPS